MRQAIDIQAFRATFARALLPTQRWPNDMKNTQLIDLLATFSPEEMKGLGDYVQSPFFNKRQAPIALYKALCPIHPTFAGLKWEKVFRKAFPDKPTYSDTYLRNVLSDLYELALGFLRQGVANKSYATGEFACIQQLINRKQFKQAEQHLEKIYEWIKDSWGDNDYNALYAEYYEYKMILHDRNEERLSYSEAHQQRENYWQKAIWTKVLMLIYEAENDRMVYFDYSYDTELLQKMLITFDPKCFEDDPICLADYYRAMLLSTHSWIWWTQLYNHAKAATGKMPDNQTYTCYRALSNHLEYHSKREHVGTIENLKLKMELVQEAAALREKNHLHLLEIHYALIAEIGYTLHGIEWAMDYIDQKKHQLLPYLQEALPDYCRALVHFQAKNYSEAIALFSQLPNFRSDLYFSVKPYLLLAYYETDNTESMEYLFLSFKKTIKNHDNLAQGTQQALNNFIITFSLLRKLSETYNEQQAAQLQSMVENPNLPLTSKQWFAQKLQEITARMQQKLPEKQDGRNKF
ncbi:MAG: hypothetical protein IPL33_07035 [Sphingobacteriales bacterium]|nr:hypothetical protein [Sphingobacteriales bacterium]